jgi:hypothetical protein
MKELRKQIAVLARQLYENKITFDEFLSKTSDQDQDELVDELIDLIEHEPQKGGLFGVNEKEHQKYITQIFTIIERLERDAI